MSKETTGKKRKVNRKVRKTQKGSCRFKFRFSSLNIRWFLFKIINLVVSRCSFC